MSDLETSASQIVAEQLAAGGRAGLTCSFQAEDVVVLHLLRQIRPEIPVLFVGSPGTELEFAL